MLPGNLNLIIKQGGTWSKTLYLAQRSVGLLLAADSNYSIVVDATAKTFTRNDGGSWLDDGLADNDYIVNDGLGETENNGPHLITDLTATVITCAGSTLKSATIIPTSTGKQIAILKARDLTDYTGAAMIRKRYSSVTPAATFTVTFDPVRFNGALTLSLTNAQTAAIPAGESRDDAKSQYVWDLELTKSGVVEPTLEGTVSVGPEATK